MLVNGQYIGQCIFLLLGAIGTILTPPATPVTAQAIESADPPPLVVEVDADKDLDADMILPEENVAVIRIEGLIYGFVLESLQRRVERAISGGATTIVIELDTPGGIVPDALKISKYLKSLIDVKTVAWVNSEAYSAGIMIAAACDRIVMSTASATGDCAPIQMGKELAPTERAKALSPILEEFRDSATQNGYDYAMFHAMCVLGVEVYQIEHKEAGRRILVNQADYQMMVEGKSRVEALEIVAPKGEEVSALTVGRVTVEVAKDEDIGQWNLVKQIHDGATLLTVNQTRAREIDLSKATIKDDEALGEWLATRDVRRIRQNWSEDLAGWLVHPAIRAVLILALMMGAYMEFQTPGLGLPGAVAAIALIVLLVSPFLIGLAEVWHLVLFFLGFSLLMIELFVTPGFAVIGILGVILMFTGLALSVVPASGSGFMPAPEFLAVLGASIRWTLVSMIASVIGVLLLVRNLNSVPVLNRLVLNNRQTAGAAATANPISGSEVVGRGDMIVGAIGRVTSELRPIGRAEINGQLTDVVSFGQWIEVGREVKIVEIHGNRIVVEPVTS